MIDGNNFANVKPKCDQHLCHTHEIPQIIKNYLSESTKFQMNKHIKFNLIKKKNQ